jgi:hypothetical protein
MMKRLRILGTDQPSEWMAVLAQTAAYDFYHLPRYHKFAEEQDEGTARLLVWSEERGTVALPLLLRRLEDVMGINGYSGGRRDAPSVYGYAGPVASGDALPEKIGANFRSALREVLEEWRVVAVFSRLHPLIPQQVDWLAGLGECKPLARTVSLDLTSPSGEQRARYRRNHKEGINKLRRRGVTVEHDRDTARLPEFIAIYHETMRRVGAATAYFFPPSYFARLRACLGPCLHLFVCRIEGEIACGGLFAECNGILQYHLGGTRDTFLRLAPMKLLFDEVREWATQRGVGVLHLGGGATTHPDDSLLHFKMGFSDRTHDFCVWRYTPTPEMYDRLCRDKARWNEENRLRPLAPDYFPAYRCPTVSTLTSEPEA